MQNNSIFLTGATGFIGAAIAKKLIKNNYSIIAIKRKRSSLTRCNSFEKKITWVDVDDENWMNTVIKFKPNCVIHAAWEGVSAGHRDEWRIQMKNLNLLIDVLEIAKQSDCSSFIGLGSQAEYGFFDGCISEEQPTNQNSSYGFAKLLSKDIVNSFCEKNGIDWVWLRLFPFFGEQESFDWFIPMLVKRLKQEGNFEMTKGEQVYAYLYVNDFAEWVHMILQKEISSGVYNISSSENKYALKDLVARITNILNIPIDAVKIGVLPYRANQTMCLAGDTAKLRKALGELPETDFNINIQNTVSYILDSIENAN